MKGPHIPAGTIGFIPTRVIFPLWRELLEYLVGHNKRESVTGAGTLRFEDSAGGWSPSLSVIGRLQFDGRDIAAVLVEALVQ
jgi:hypothetical protein